MVQSTQLRPIRAAAERLAASDHVIIADTDPFAWPPDPFFDTRDPPHHPPK